MNLSAEHSLVFFSGTHDPLVASRMPYWEIPRLAGHLRSGPVSSLGQIGWLAQSSAPAPPLICTENSKYATSIVPLPVGPCNYIRRAAGARTVWTEPHSVPECHA